ncbi:unnamed protein product [Adineta ricciae]|uniref:Uncharacterized protein n=1 Tax=Adineta ricciae TaxID=249248 RepID=A0A814VY28_ADIRI|nr:unnamed protein product [Adineta ricciae]CAF1509748.1 unnamed protein product [Adineta ricciae]
MSLTIIHIFSVSFLGYDNLSFDKEITYPVESYSSQNSLASDDFNNHTYLDLVIANYNTSTITIFLISRDALFINQTLYSTGSDSFPSLISVNHFNNDAKLDIIVTNPDSSTLGMFLGRNDGTFENMIIFSFAYGSHSFSIIVGDFNDDHKLNFAIGNVDSNTLDILLQTC